jgi:hypothetical protein
LAHPRDRDLQNVSDLLQAARADAGHASPGKRQQAKGIMTNAAALDS